MNRTDRLYALTEELRVVSPRPRSGSWLAEHLEVSVRTIERDIAVLQEAGIPVAAENGRAGGYVLDRAWSRSLLETTPEEVLAMAVAVRALTGTAFEESARSGLRRLLAALPRPEVATLRLLTDRIRLGQPLEEWEEFEELGAEWDEVPQVGVLRLGYRDERGEMTVREVEPLGLFGGAEHWYLLAWCRLRSAIRAFRLDRVLGLEPTHEPVPDRRIPLSALVVRGTDLLALDLADPIPIPAA
jgi:predicted DNA-binding transcriptional regulator YafY